MITTDKRTPCILIQSASGDIWSIDKTEAAALDAYIKAGGRPGHRVFILATDKDAHLNTDRNLVFRQRSAVWEARVLPGHKLDYVREVMA